MLQQTTVGTVLNKFPVFMKRFPNIKTLATAEESEVLNEWIGLGYYRRARNLKRATEYFYTEFNSKIPLNYSELIKVPGVGEYTARALLSIGGNEKELAVDANLERVLARFYKINSKDIKTLKKEIQAKFTKGEILKNHNIYSARDINESIMDLGRTICKANTFLCDECPISNNCKAFKTGMQKKYPIKDKKVKKEYNLKLLRIIVKKGNKILAYKKNDKEWLSGQLEIPTFILHSEDKNLTQYPKKKRSVRDLKSFKTSITKYKIDNFVLVHDKPISGKKYKFYEIDFDKNNFSTATKKALKYK